MPDFLRRGIRNHLICSCIWLIGVLVMWWGATTSSISAFIAVPIVAFTSFGMGIAWSKMLAITRPYLRMDRKHMYDIPYYRLEGKETVRLKGWEEWRDWHAAHMDECKVRTSTFAPVADEGESLISTVFIGLGHLTDLKGNPLVFETLIMTGPLAGHEWKTATYQEALDAHITATMILKEVLEAYHDPDSIARRAENAHLN